MDDWNTRQHGQSGLIDRIRRSNVTMAQAETETIAFLSKYVESGRSPMCGNSICQDRRFWHVKCQRLSGFSLPQFRCVNGQRACLSLAPRYFVKL